MGVAGSGKSVQGRLLADEYGYPWLSSGNFLRMLVSGERRRAMLEGKLLDDSEIITLIQKIFSIIDVKNEFVLDGFPRTTQQAEWLLSQVKARQLNLTAVIHIVIDESVVRKRLIERGRPDDNDGSIAERFREYNTSTVPIIKLFEQNGITVYEIDGNQSVAGVHAEIVRVFKG